VSPRRSSRQRLAALALGALVGIALAEVAARLLEPTLAVDPLIEAIGDRVPDPLLEYRTEPFSGENDAHGHRNEESPPRADVVALGDSQTWGVNAEIDETWPAQLARITGDTVYNMGRGGYGIVHYRHQVEQALLLEPRWIVVALYFGNDVWDAYSLVYSLPAHESLRHPDPAIRDRIVESAYPDLKQMFFERINYRPEAPGRAREKGAEPDEPSWLLANSALARTFDRAGATPADAGSDRDWARDHPEDGFVYEDDSLATVFHSRYRLAGVDTSLPKIREGLRITLRVLADIQERLDEVASTRLLVVLLPTKERVFAGAVEEAGTGAPASHRRSVLEEERISRGLTRLMETRGIDYVDLLPALEASVEQGEAIFPPNVDGHFTPRGYRLIAERVAEAVANER
jgi:hypothetical protein